jgi:hypothetical protein
VDFATVSTGIFRKVEYIATSPRVGEYDES